MEANWGYPGEITSGSVNQGCDDDISKHSKKRKFISDMNRHLSFPASKYICCETLVEHDPFSRESHQAKVFYTYVRKDKTSLEEVDEDIGVDSVQESVITVGDSFSGCSGVKPDGYANENSYEGSCSSYSSSGAVIPRNAYSYFGSTATGSIATSIDREYSISSHQDIEFDGNGNCEDLLDEFGHCLGYLVSACDNDSKQQMNEELDDIVYMNGMVSKAYPLLSEGLIVEQVAQLSARKPTIDLEFEEYFSTLML